MASGWSSLKTESSFMPSCMSFRITRRIQRCSRAVVCWMISCITFVFSPVESAAARRSSRSLSWRMVMGGPGSSARRFVRGSITEKTTSAKLPCSTSHTRMHKCRCNV